MLASCPGSSPLTRGKPGRRAEVDVNRRLIPAHAGKTESAWYQKWYRPGSSPLTRGKLSGPCDRTPGRRLIPAHAGKTTSHGAWGGRGWAHPRSRGENGVSKNTKAPRAGSSPLTRGKHDLRDRLSPESRLIPAHAGKTGVDFNEADVIGGSSPLTRGKPRIITGRTYVMRLIPAHAGKTLRNVFDGWDAEAHPRSRGENELTDYVGDADNGSSPLTRGKPTPINGHVVVGWLIPAHAGKTGLRTRRASVAQAHPRSRGENLYSPVSQEMCRGSSPLTRGKRDGGVVDGDEAGLIPAHAGKTWRQRLPFRLLPAHPRSRGENSCGDWSPSTHAGSSPLTRGKPAGHPASVQDARLIPAHAGKTSTRRTRTSAPAAHPRSRGENTVHKCNISDKAGSSPLTRGKRHPRALDRTPGRLIPAHAGKTRAGGRPRVRRPAHPRSRGEN